MLSLVSNFCVAQLPYVLHVVALVDMSLKMVIKYKESQVFKMICNESIDHHKVLGGAMEGLILTL